MHNHFPINHTAKSFSYNALLTEGGYPATAQFFYALFDTMPNFLYFYEGINYEDLFINVIREYKIPPEKVWQTHYYYKSVGRNELYEFLIQIEEGLMIGRNSGGGHVHILYNDKIEKAKIDALAEIVKLHFTEEVVVEGKIFLLYESGGYLYLQDFEVKKGPLDINMNYNDDFAKVNDLILKRLNKENDKGLVLLHGEPGTGKTSYIRYLTTQVSKKLIYIPSEYANKIASPDFLPLMISNPNSVLIIEDAENILESREDNTRNAAVSSLLNVADGLLSDCLNLQIVCTFNTHINNIDKALLRKGRLIANYEFKALHSEKAQKLSDSLGYKYKIDSDRTLSEIFNPDEG